MTPSPLATSFADLCVCETFGVTLVPLANRSSFEKGAPAGGTGSRGLEKEKEEEGGSIDTPAFFSFILFCGAGVVTEGVPINNSISLSIRERGGGGGGGFIDCL